MLRVSTCPFCLPAGAITWLIDNGRQLDLMPEYGLTVEEHEFNLDRSISVSAFNSTLEE